MKKNPKQNRESSLMRSPLILGLSMVLCIPVAYSHAKSSNIVNNESVQSILLLQQKEQIERKQEQQTASSPVVTARRMLLTLNDRVIEE